MKIEQVDFKTLSKGRIFTTEIREDDEGRFLLAQFKNETLINSIYLTKKDVQSMMNFVDSKEVA